MSGSSSSPSRSHAGPDPTWTSRQREVLDLLVRGQTNAQIAETLGISLDGAKWHVSEVITKLGVDSRDEAAEYWRAHNGLRLRFTRMVHALIASTWLKVGAGAAVVAGAAVAVAVVIIALNDSGTSPVAAVSTPTTAAATTAPGSTCLNDLLPPPAPGQEQDPWLRARAMLPPDVPVLRPTYIPAGLGSPILEEVCVGPLPFSDTPEVPRYTVVYPDGGQNTDGLTFILTTGAGAAGNFPGPPTGREQVTVRGQTADLLTTANVSSTTPGLTAFMLSWKEQGFSYQLKMGSTGRLTKDDLLRTAEGLAPVP